MSVVVSTQIGVRFWEWDEIKNLPMGARFLWLGLYTSGAGRLAVPGLFFGSITAMSEAVHLPVDETLVHLEQLLKADLVEYDRERRVLRFTKLPDACEAPSNGNTVRGWWRKFQCIPECQVRDAHVATIRWLIDTSAKERGKKVSEDHQTAWSETFAMVAIPAPRKRGVRSLVEHDTGTEHQPSLFGNRSGTVSSGASPSAEADLRRFEADPETPNDLAGPETIRGTVPGTMGIGSGTGRGLGSGSASGSDSGDPDWSAVQGTDPGARATCGTVSAPPPPAPLRLVPLPVDARDRRRGEILRAIGTQHALAFQRVKKAIGSTAFGPGMVDDHAELRDLLQSMPSLEEAMERCQHVLAIREAEATRKNTLQYFGGGMWRRQNYEKALTLELADVNGTRASAAPAPRARVDVINEFFDDLEDKESNKERVQ